MRPTGRGGARTPEALLHRLACLISIQVAFAGCAPAHVSPSAAAPAVLAERLLAADSSRDWRTLLRHAHSDALLEFRETQGRMLEPEPFGLALVDTCMQRLMGSPSIVEQRELHVRSMLDSIFRVPTVDSLRGLDPDTAFARYGAHLARFPAVERGPHAPTRKILGALVGPGETAYVLVYQRYDSLPFSGWPRERTETMTFRREQGEWRSMLDGPLTLGSGTGVMMFEGED